MVGPLAELLFLAWGPLQVVAEEFSGLPATDRVLIFGSWAPRYRQQQGPPPHDLDVLVVGQSSREAVGTRADGSPLLKQAHRTVATAAGLVSHDPYSAYVLAYDAARFACVAPLAQQGLVIRLVALAEAAPQSNQTPAPNQPRASPQRSASVPKVPQPCSVQARTSRLWAADRLLGAEASSGIQCLGGLYRAHEIVVIVDGVGRAQRAGRCPVVR